MVTSTDELLLGADPRRIDPVSGLRSAFLCRELIVWREAQRVLLTTCKVAHGARGELWTSRQTAYRTGLMLAPMPSKTQLTAALLLLKVLQTSLKSALRLLRTAQMPTSRRQAVSF